jgi:organic hydroperoxide reductase OsmC/OhrA
MAEHTATIRWFRENDANFLDNRYSRAHSWTFDGGAEILASSSPHVVPVPMSEPGAVDPEESFVASLSSCHMLWFLSIAAKRRFIVNEYVDKARGIMGNNSEGRVAITSVTLSPQVKFQGDHQPSPAEIESMHRAAHDNCYIASSVKSEIHCNPIIHKL